MAGLTVQNFVSAAVGIAVAIALVRGLVRRTAHDHRQLLGGPGAGHAVHPAADRHRGGRAAGRPGRHPDAERPGHRGHPRGRRSRPSRSGRSRAQEAIKELGTNGGGSVQRELGPPVREPDRAHQLAPASPHPGHPVRPDRDVRAPRRRPAPGLGPVRGDGRHPRAGARWRSARDRGNPLFPAGIDGALGNLEGKETRFGAVDGAIFATITTGTSTGCRERDARELPADRRARAADAHAARRDRARAASAPACTGCSCSRSSRCSSRASWSAGHPSTWARRSRPSR